MPGNNPGATEILNRLDDNCDGNIDEGLVSINKETNSVIQLLIYPVPSSDKINLILPAENKLPLTLTIYNLHGELISRVIANDHNFEIDISDYAMGVYLVRGGEMGMGGEGVFVKE